MKKWWVKLLLALAAVVLVISFLVATSSVHSKNSVERYKDQLRVAGERLDIQDLDLPHVDPDKNGAELFRQAFAAMPALTDIVSSNPPPTMKMVAPGKAMIGWQQAEIISDDISRGTNSWAELDQELQSFIPALDFIRQASERPEVNFDLDYKQGVTLLLPHLAKLKRSALLISASAIVNLHRRDSTAAATNLHTLLATLDGWKDEPLLISQLVRMAMVQIAVPAQWEFLQSTNITDEELAILQRAWSNLQLISPMEKSLLTERVWTTLYIEELRTSNSPSSIYTEWTAPGGSSSGGSDDWLDSLKDLGESVKRKTSDSLWRVSWSYDDELETLQGEQVLIESVRQVSTNGYFKNALADRDRKMAELGLDHPSTNWLRVHLEDGLAGLGAETAGSIGRSLERLQACETARTIAVTAVALKRYQLRHQTYPGSLDELVPEFLAAVPRDPVDGHPLRYQALPDGTFLLYSIGTDGVDNGGDASPMVGSKTFQWQRGRDWVWPQPATRQEIEFFRANPPK